MNDVLRNRLLNAAVALSAVFAASAGVWALRTEGYLPGLTQDEPSQGGRVRVGDTVLLNELIPIANQNPAGGPTPEPGATVIAVLTTTCPYCERTLGAWTELAGSVEPHGVGFNFLSLSPVDATQSYVRAHDLGYPTWSIGGSVIRVSTVPTTLLIGPTGVVLAARQGVLDADDLDTLVILAKEATDAPSSPGD